jgi:hypothetical protein
VPLPDFSNVRPHGEDDAQFVAKIEVEADKVIGSYGARE